MGYNLRPCLAVASHLILERRQLLRPDGTPRMELAGGDSDLRAEAELAAVGILGRGVPQDDGAIDLVEEIFGGGALFGDDRLGVTGPEAADVRDCIIDVLDCLHAEDRRE